MTPVLVVAIHVVPVLAVPAAAVIIPIAGSISCTTLVRVSFRFVHVKEINCLHDNFTICCKEATSLAAQHFQHVGKQSSKKQMLPGDRPALYKFQHMDWDHSLLMSDI